MNWQAMDAHGRGWCAVVGMTSFIITRDGDAYTASYQIAGARTIYLKPDGIASDQKEAARVFPSFVEAAVACADAVDSIRWRA